MLGPLIAGSTRPSWIISVIQTDNNPFNLTGATFTGVLRDVSSNLIITLAGSYSITDAANGTFTYAPVAADVAVPGIFIWETVITISSQPTAVQLPLTIQRKMAA